MARVSIRGKQYYVKEVFSDEFAFSVPVYQRPYAWTEDEAGELFDDLLGFLGKSEKPIEELNPYFLGSIVLIKEDDKPEAQIVDGQQRLITLTILLAALRATLSNELASDLTTFIVEKGSLLRGTEDRLRLTPRPKDALFFRTHIQDENGIENLDQVRTIDLGSDSQRNFVQNALVYTARLQEMKEPARQRFAEFLTKQCCLVIVSTPDLESAFRIFTILNDRGLDLSHTDILKSEIIGALPKELQVDYGDKWEDIEDYLGRELFEDLFSHIRMIYRKAKLRGTVLSEIRDYVKPSERPRAFIDNILAPTASAFHTIIHQSYSSETLAEKVNYLLEWLNRIDNVDWLPAAIAYLSRYHTEPEQLVRFFTHLERLAGGLMVRRANINERINRFARLVEAIERQEDLFSEDSPLQLTADDKRLILEVLDGNLYLVRKIYTYVLLRLDAALSGGEARYQYPVISVEHVLPQTPNPDSKWMEWFPSEEDREMWVHRLSNLVLLSTKKNAQAKNYEFDIKKEKYFATKDGVSPFAITTQVINEPEWKPEVLERRQEQLLDVFKKTWRLD